MATEQKSELQRVKESIRRKVVQKAHESRKHVDERINSVEHKLNNVKADAKADAEHTKQHLEGIVHQKGVWIIIAVALIVAASVVINIVAN